MLLNGFGLWRSGKGPKLSAFEFFAGEPIYAFASPSTAPSLPFKRVAAWKARRTGQTRFDLRLDGQRRAGQRNPLTADQVRGKGCGHTGRLVTLRIPRLTLNAMRAYLEARRAARISCRRAVL